MRGGARFARSTPFSAASRVRQGRRRRREPAGGARRRPPHRPTQASLPPAHDAGASTCSVRAGRDARIARRRAAGARDGPRAIEGNAAAPGSSGAFFRAGAGAGAPPPTARGLVRAHVRPASMPGITVMPPGRACGPMGVGAARTGARTRPCCCRSRRCGERHGCFLGPPQGRAATGSPLPPPPSRAVRARVAGLERPDDVKDAPLVCVGSGGAAPFVGSVCSSYCPCAWNRDGRSRRDGRISFFSAAPRVRWGAGTARAHGRGLYASAFGRHTPTPHLRPAPSPVVVDQGRCARPLKRNGKKRHCLTPARFSFFFSFDRGVESLPALKPGATAFPLSVRRGQDQHQGLHRPNLCAGVRRCLSFFAQWTLRRAHDRRRTRPTTTLGRRRPARRRRRRRHRPRLGPGCHPPPAPGRPWPC
jgi:hypothetical protein